MSLSDSSQVSCPICSEMVAATARKCRWCLTWFSEVEWRTGDEQAVRAIDTVTDTASSHQASDRPVRWRNEICDERAVLVVGVPNGGLAATRVRDINEHVTQMRHDIVRRFGIVPPPVQIRGDDRLAPNEIRVLIKGDLVVEHRVTADGKRTASAAACAAVVSRVLIETLAETVTSSDVDDIVAKTYHAAPNIVDELIPRLLTHAQLRRIIRLLVTELVPLTDMVTLFEILADAAAYTTNRTTLAEWVRYIFGRKITNQYRGPDGKLHIVMLEPELIEQLTSSIVSDELESRLVLDATTRTMLLQQVRGLIDAYTGVNPRQIVIAAPTSIRRALADLLRCSGIRNPVLSEREYEAHARTVVVGSLPFGIHAAMDVARDDEHAIQRRLALAARTG